MEQPNQDDLNNTRQDSPALEENGSQFPKTQVRFSLTLMFMGLVIFLIGINPALFGLDRGTAIGFVQILAILVGLGLLTWGAVLTMLTFWRNEQKTLLADFGSRVVATGYVICIFTALADAFGFGTNPFPNVFLGTLQSQGLIIGMIVIGIGLLMMVRYKR